MQFERLAFAPRHAVTAGVTLAYMPDSLVRVSRRVLSGPLCLLQIFQSARRSPERLLPLQFQALFNSFSKVLFNFPSRYLFAIGLSQIFSLRWSLPPASCYNIVQHYSRKRVLARPGRVNGAAHPLWRLFHKNFSLPQPLGRASQTTTEHY